MSHRKNNFMVYAMRKEIPVMHMKLYDDRTKKTTVKTISGYKHTKYNDIVKAFGIKREGIYQGKFRSKAVGLSKERFELMVKMIQDKGFKYIYIIPNDDMFEQSFKESALKDVDADEVVEIISHPMYITSDANIKNNFVHDKDELISVDQANVDIATKNAIPTHLRETDTIPKNEVFDYELKYDPSETGNPETPYPTPPETPASTPPQTPRRPPKPKPKPSPRNEADISMDARISEIATEEDASEGVERNLNMSSIGDLGNKTPMYRGDKNIKQNRDREFSRGLEKLPEYILPPAQNNMFYSSDNFNKFHTLRTFTPFSHVELFQKETKKLYKNTSPFAKYFYI